MKTNLQNPTNESEQVSRRESGSCRPAATSQGVPPTFPLSHFPTFILQSLVAVLLLAAFAPTRAEIPEPDNVLYGSIAIANVAITASRTDVVVEARRQTNGPVVASYRMGSNPQVGNFYSLRLKLESLAPVFDPTASETGAKVVLVVSDASGVRAQASYMIGERGQFERLDFGTAVTDSDGDGLPDAWEAHHFANLSQNASSLNANGLTALQNFVAGTNPNDPNSAFKLNIALNGSQKTVSFIALRAEGPGYDGLTRVYSLETNPTLAGSSWAGVTGFTDIAGNNQNVAYQTVASTPAFFRGKITLQPLDSPAIDSDSDGLPDSWETEHFGGLNRGAATIGANGQTALQSFTAGNNPNDANSVFKLNVTLGSGQKVVSFQALRAEGTGYEGKNRYYTLQSRSSLTVGSWVDVAGFVRLSADNQAVIYQTSATFPSFFRAAVWLEDQ